MLYDTHLKHVAASTVYSYKMLQALLCTHTRCYRLYHVLIQDATGSTVYSYKMLLAYLLTQDQN